jgi:hypothetical protein
MQFQAQHGISKPAPLVAAMNKRVALSGSTRGLELVQSEEVLNELSQEIARRTVEVIGEIFRQTCSYCHDMGSSMEVDLGPEIISLNGEDIRNLNGEVRELMQKLRVSLNSIESNHRSAMDSLIRELSDQKELLRETESKLQMERNQTRNLKAELNRCSQGRPGVMTSRSSLCWGSFEPSLLQGALTVRSMNSSRTHRKGNP